MNLKKMKYKDHNLSWKVAFQGPVTNIKPTIKNLKAFKKANNSSQNKTRISNQFVNRIKFKLGIKSKNQNNQTEDANNNY